MPSTIVGNPVASGAQIIVSGNPYSGTITPYGGIQLRLDRSCSGNVYVGSSSNITVNSGGMFLSGGGINDGIPLYPGDSYFIPIKFTGMSGSYSIYARHDAACSGQGRLYWEMR